MQNMLYLVYLLKAYNNEFRKFTINDHDVWEAGAYIVAIASCFSCSNNFRGAKPDNEGIRSIRDGTRSRF